MTSDIQPIEPWRQPRRSNNPHGASPVSDLRRRARVALLG